MICKVCGTEHPDGECTKCGYEQGTMLNGVEEPESEKKFRLEYKKKVAEKITDISVIGKQGKVDKAKGLVIDASPIYYKIADGKDCFNKTVWGSQEYCMHPEDVWKKEYLEISYKVCGKESKAKTLVMPIQSGYFWQVGVNMNEDFGLEFYLGHSDKYEVSDRIKVDFENLQM